MARLKKKKFDHEISFENFEINSLDGRITRHEESPYLYLEEKFQNLMMNPWESKLQVVIELHFNGGF